MPESIQGLQSLLDKLGDLPLTMGKTLIVQALRKGALPIQERAAELAPDDPETSGSRIRDNMMTTVTQATADGAIAKVGPSKLGWVSGFSEFGTAHQARRPFLQPAYDQKVDEAIRIIGLDLAEGIERELKKLGT